MLNDAILRRCNAEANFIVHCSILEFDRLGGTPNCSVVGREPNVSSSIGRSPIDVNLRQGSGMSNVTGQAAIFGEKEGTRLIRVYSKQARVSQPGDGHREMFNVKEASMLMYREEEGHLLVSLNTAAY